MMTSASRRPKVGRTGSVAPRHAPWVVVANLLTAVGNLVGVFAISVAASDASEFGVVATSLAAMVFAFGINHALVAETLALSNGRHPGVRSFLATCLTVALPLALLAGAALAFDERTRPLAALTVLVVACQLLVDDLRHWGFHQGRARRVALADGLWLGATGVLYLLALVGAAGPRPIYVAWAFTGLVLVAALVRVGDDHISGDAPGRVVWPRDEARTSLRLGIEAMAATAAVTVPLIAAPLVGASTSTPGAVRILQAFFGFQQIAFFSALASTRHSDAPSARVHRGRRAGLLLAGGGTALSLVVGLVVATVPTSVLRAVFGDGAGEAQAGIEWFVLLQVVIACGNGAIVWLRLTGRAAAATTPRVVGNAVAAVAATALMGRGVAGYATGSAVGLGFVAVTVAVLAFRPPEKSSSNA